jgi:hypothetical protein
MDKKLRIGVKFHPEGNIIHAGKWENDEPVQEIWIWPID